MNGQTRVKINIRGVDYFVVSEGSEEYIRSIGEELDTRMSELMGSNDRISTTMAAVLCAMSYCDECRKASNNADNLRVQVKDYLDDSQKARVEAEDAKREIERLKRELQALRNRLADLDDR